MDEHHKIVEKSARYFTLGKPTDEVRDVWICLHGYGQLVKYFGRQFQAFETAHRYFVFPEGQHRFYLNGTAGRVGASWMTKEDRLTDIQDQFIFLESLLCDVLQQLPQGINVHVLGFSQGVATALRWIDQSKIDIKSLVCWAGSFPPDIDYKLHKQRFDTIRMHACFGDTDEYISAENAQKLLRQVADQQIDLHPHFYEGGHKIYPKLLEELIASCEVK